MKKRLGCVFAVLLCVLLCGCETQMEKGTELLEKCDYAGAQEAFQLSVDKGKDLAEAYRGIGFCCWEQEKYEEAYHAFGKAMDEGGEKTAVLYNMMGICALKMELPEKAVYYFEEGRQMSDASEELKKEMFKNEIVIYEKLKEYETAKAKLQEYITLYPEDQDAVKEYEFLETQL